VDNTVPLKWSDVTVIDRTNKKVALIDIAIPLTHSLQDTATEKQCKYQDLPFEINQQWQLNKTTIIPLVLPAI